MKNKELAKSVYDKNLTIASQNLLGFGTQVLEPTEENLRKFHEQFNGVHNLCRCVGCIELSKMFIKNDRDLNEVVIGVSTKELDGR